MPTTTKSIQTKPTNEHHHQTNEFSVRIFLSHPKMDPYRSCAIHTTVVHLFIRYSTYIFRTKLESIYSNYQFVYVFSSSSVERSLYVYSIYKYICLYSIFFSLFFGFFLNTVYLRECECCLSVVDKVHYSYLVTHIRYSPVVTWFSSSLSLRCCCCCRCFISLYFQLLFQRLFTNPFVWCVCVVFFRGNLRLYDFVSIVDGLPKCDPMR